MIDAISDGKKPCIWMEAGVVDFKLCNHCFDCASCAEFNSAMTAVAAQDLSLRDACELTLNQPDHISPLRHRMRQRSFEQLLEDQSECYASLDRPQVREVYGFGVPTSLYLHQGHAWVALETCGRVRIGLDDPESSGAGGRDEAAILGISA